jgi:vacuolar-type H+-ATPase subunit I/STV1
MSEVYTAEEIGAVVELIRSHQKQQGIVHGGSLSQRVSGVLSEYRLRTAEALADCQREREDTRVFLRAIGLLVATCGNADTHKEKNARLRAVSEMIESAVQKLAETTSEFLLSRRADLFAADYPTRHLVERIRNLQRELELYQKQVEEPKCQNPKPNDDVPM